MIQDALLLCDHRKRFLFEVLPDYFPQGRLTGIERELWGRYYKRKERER